MRPSRHNCARVSARFDLPRRAGATVRATVRANSHVVARHRHHHGFAQQRLEHERGRPRDRHAQQPAVQPPRLQRVGQLGGVVLLQLQLDLREAAPVSAQRFGNEAMRGRRTREPYRHHAFHPLSDTRHACSHRVHVLQHAHGFDLQLLAGVGERHATRMAPEERHPEFALEQLDLLAERRLLDAQLLRSSGDVTALRNGGEVAQASHVHMIFVSEVPDHFI